MVGIVIVSHSRKAAEGIFELAVQMAGENHNIVACGGMEDGGIGTDAIQIKNAVLKVYSNDGVVILADLGSAILSSQAAIELLDDENMKVIIADAPVLEGAVSAAVQAYIGGDIKAVVEAAELAGHTSKLC